MLSLGLRSCNNVFGCVYIAYMCQRISQQIGVCVSVLRPSTTPRSCHSTLQFSLSPLGALLPITRMGRKGNYWY